MIKTEEARFNIFMELQHCKNIYTSMYPEPFQKELQVYLTGFILWMKEGERFNRYELSKHETKEN